MKLSLPAIDHDPDPSVEIRPVYVEEWVEALPNANLPTLLARTLEAVEQLNRQPLKPSLRMDLLDLYIRPYAFALESHRTQSPAHSGGALARQRSVSRLLGLSAVAMALGYNQALSNLRARRLRLRGTREARLAIQRSILFSSLALLHCYDEYRPPLPGLWLEVVALCEMAARDGLDREPVPAKVHDPAFSRSIGECFKRLCLTSLVDPYHLAYGELWSIYHAFDEYAELAVLEPVRERPRPAGLFIIDPGHDGRPRPRAQVTTPPDAHCQVLDANPVLHSLQERHRRYAPGDPVESHVLAAMIRALGLPPKRHTPREESDGRIRLAVGLSTVHHFLSPMLSHSGNDSTDAERPAMYRHQSWQLLNEGHGGIGIVRDSQPDSTVGVGELVSLQFPLRGDAEDEWSVGVVRWMNISDSDEYQAGVQVICDVATPVLAHAESVTETITRIPRPSIAVPAVNADPASTIIAPRGMFTKGALLRIVSGNRTWLIRAQALSESTFAFDRFTFSLQ